VVEALTAEIKATLGEQLLGLYLYGSYVRGGFDPDVSDVDLLAVTADEVQRLDLPALEQMHADFVRRHPEWSDRLDVIYIGRRTLDSFRTNQGSLAVISPGEPFHVTSDVVDWLMNWYHVLEGGVTLFGPEPSELIPPITWEEFAAAVARYVEWFRSEIAAGRGAGYRAYAVLSTCRALYAVRNGRPASKQEAAAWTKERTPDWAWLIDAALRARLAYGRGFDDPRTLAAANAFIDQVAEGLGSAKEA
jgi:aminoglycoside adenylyltransferase-like protein/nucleotidyltransferase-like protein